MLAGAGAGGGDQVAATCPASIIRTAESYTAAVAGRETGGAGMPGSKHQILYTCISLRNC